MVRQIPFDPLVVGSQTYEEIHWAMRRDGSHESHFRPARCQRCQSREIADRDRRTDKGGAMAMRNGANCGFVAFRDLVFLLTCIKSIHAHHVQHHLILPSER